MTADEELFASLSQRLLETHRRVASLDTDVETKGDVVRRLIAITNASKHDLSRASERLDALIAALDAGTYSSADES